MALQMSQAARNARLNAIETTVGATAKLRLCTGSPPADCAAAQTGTQLAELTLPLDWMSDAASGSKAKLGTWSGTGSAGPANAGYFRVVDNAGTTCHVQGTVTITGGGGDMTLDNPNIAPGQAITITTFTLTDGNA